MISISIVSHCQIKLVEKLLTDFLRLPATINIEILITLNVPEVINLDEIKLPWPVKVIKNASPKGFGANHNAAFQLSGQGEWFCAMNPDIRLLEDPFTPLLTEIARQPAAVIGPAVCNPVGHVEDSVRYFPTLSSLVCKLLGRSEGTYSFGQGDETFCADWVGGMFMLFRAEDYRAIGGFDEGFFLYYEDVDICARLWKSGRAVYACPKVKVIHDARRTSRRNLRYMRWHLTSLLRYLYKHWGRLPRGRIS